MWAWWVLCAQPESRVPDLAQACLVLMGWTCFSCGFPAKVILTWAWVFWGWVLREDPQGFPCLVVALTLGPTQ